MQPQIILMHSMSCLSHTFFPEHIANSTSVCCCHCNKRSQQLYYSSQAEENECGDANRRAHVSAGGPRFPQ